MIAVDTNVLVYAHRSDNEFHDRAMAKIRELAEGRSAWAIPWPCVHEFFSVVTHPRIYAPPSTSAQAIAQIDAWLTSPSLVMIGETKDHWKTLRSVIESGRVLGPMVHDARIAAVCAANGVRELWTLDRDFSRFPAPVIRNLLKD
ncbi:type II toxin-antitoxin system VapC family toxin [Streptosporangium pseudovulgare]|uniref:Ribonuclease VapC n=1 Tax=Streptosporangium pseudovulgare TaxID=35765 RepID=A0ABQ2QQI8_9ACTN|nr:TA system VapC family ribonuclease toxin [Streptosporangium pseudovulgare]GGP89694.1 VapC ribonuclease [Streptosporangium pseudovulgare]